MSRRWAQQWLQVLDDTRPEARLRLTRGRTYQRSGRVVDVRIDQGLVAGRVQGSRSTPYAVRIGVPLLSDDAWMRVAGAIAGQARHTARLLAGLAPEGLERELAAVGIGLLSGVEALELDCDCGDDFDPCAHVVALWEAAAHRLLDEPLLLLRVRGRGHQQLLADVAAVRRAGAPSEGERHVPVAELDAEGWWTASRTLDDLPIPPGTRPATPAPALRLAGDPPGWAGGVSAWDLLRAWIDGAGRWAEALGSDGYLGERSEALTEDS